MSNLPIKYKRVLLKISGESLCKPGVGGIDPEELKAVSQEIIEATKTGVEIAIVVGGGNIIRGATLAKAGHIPQATADRMGMLGTAINALALKEMLETLGQPARVLTAINLTSVAEPFILGRANRHLEKGRVVILGAGTGNPFFTTDTAAALRAVELGAQVLMKATKVDGVYDKDPNIHADAKKYDVLSFNTAISKNLGIMDTAAFDLCQQHHVPIYVFNFKEPGNIARAVAGESIGTLIEPEQSTA